MSRVSLARTLAALAGVSLLVASAIHSGYLVEGYPHDGAALPEAVIGSVVLVGLALSWLRRPWGRRSLIGGLAFGLAGSTLGLVLVIIGVGPQSTPDVVYHIGLIVCLVAGLVAAIGTPRPTARTG